MFDPHDPETWARWREQARMATNGVNQMPFVFGGYQNLAGPQGAGVGGVSAMPSQQPNGNDMGNGHSNPTPPANSGGGGFFGAPPDKSQQDILAQFFPQTQPQGQPQPQQPLPSMLGLQQGTPPPGWYGYDPYGYPLTASTYVQGNNSGG